jgi:hypothetical protein
MTTETVRPGKHHLNKIPSRYCGLIFKTNNMKEKIVSLKNTARNAGWLYLIVICASLFAHVYVPLQIFVRGDAGATALNIINHENLFRSCILVNLAGTIAFLFLAIHLQRMFEVVDVSQSKFMLALAGIQVPIVLTLAVFKFTALMVVKGELPELLSPGESPDLTMLFLQMNGYGMLISELLSGLWLLPLGWLAYQSRFIPRILGLLLILAGFGYLLDSVITMILPDVSGPFHIIAYVSFGLGEIPMMLWLLIKGVRDHLSIEVVSEIKPMIKPDTVYRKEYVE